MITSRYQVRKQWLSYLEGKHHVEKVIHNTVEFNRSPLCWEKWQDRLRNSVALNLAVTSARPCLQP